MTIFFHEYEASRQRRELEALDRKLEHWGWYRRHEGKSLPAEYSTPGHIPAYVLDDIAAFVKKPAGR